MIKCKELIRILEKDGWVLVSVKGSHMKYQHPQKNGRVLVPFHGNKDFSKGIFYAILKQAGLKWRK